MKITIDFDLSDEEKKRLIYTLHCKDETEFNKVFPRYAAAAIREYSDLFLGKHVASTGPEIRQNRLLLLIRYAFRNQIPDEQVVSELFQTTLSQSRTLINTVLSKYRFELNPLLDESMRNTIARARHDQESDFYEISPPSNLIVDRMNRVLAQVDGTLSRIVKKPGSVSTYRMKPSVYSELRKFLHMN